MQRAEALPHDRSLETEAQSSLFFIVDKEGIDIMSRFLELDSSLAAEAVQGLNFLFHNPVFGAEDTDLVDLAVIEYQPRFRTAA